MKGQILRTVGEACLAVVAVSALPPAASGANFLADIKPRDINAAPEPLSMVLIGGGLIGLACIARRKRV